MSIDTTAITTGVTDLINQAFEFLPLGLAIIGIPTALFVGIRFGGRIAQMVAGALGGSGK
ncbi:MAG: hypothetical protein LCI00_05520 [Chloroflexi bacterium]|nr:hypothetical protein [Chloroflexota bacterium]